MCQDEKTTVNLRIEGKTKTIFEGPIATCGHRITGNTNDIPPKKITCHCNGTNNDKNPCAGPTCTTALDDANKVANFGFNATYFPAFDDFMFTSIGSDTATNPDFWAICLDFVSIGVGGCQQKVKKDDQVLFAYATRKVTKHYLKLSGPKVAIVNVPFELTVTDGTEAPIEGATVGGKKTDKNGKVSITFSTKGTEKLKAEKQPDSVRSNQHVIQVREYP